MHNITVTLGQVEGFMGRQSGNIYRTTVSVPIDLKERMDAVAGQVNWSQVAVRAFEEKLAELAAAKTEKTMGDAIQRLRASKLRGEDEAWTKGYEAGQEWARDEAEAEELDRLATLVGRVQHDRDFDWTSSDAYGIANHVLAEISGEDRIDRRDSEEFWKAALGEKYPQGNILYGFACGASNFWNEIREKL
jgi:hypothetical protein